MDKTTDQLLNLLEAEIDTTDSEAKYCIIDPDTREIYVDPDYQRLGVESDEKAERILFRCPKTVGDGLDLTQYQLRINYQNANDQKGQYLVEDVTVDGDDVLFSWLLHRPVTAYQGTVRFIVCAISVGDGGIKNEWNTTIAQCDVLEGLEVEDPVIPTPEEDIIAQLIQHMQDKSEQALEAIETAEQEAIEQIQSEKVDIDKLTIKANASGIGSVSVDDSADWELRNLKITGKTVQQKTNGYQLFDASKLSTKSQGGATVTNNDDGSFTVSGSGNLTDEFANMQYSINSDDFKKLFKVGNVYLKGAINKGIYFEVKYIKSDGNLYQRNNQTINLTDEIYNAITSVTIVFYGNSGIAIPNETIKPMLYQDGDGTWEPYTGGKPAPNPDYPMEIENVEISNISSHGRQLFDSSKIVTKTQSGATLTNNNDGSFTVSGSGNLTDNFIVTYNISVSEKKSLFKGNTPIKGLRKSSQEKETVPYFRLTVMKDNVFYHEIYDNSTITEDEMNDDTITLQFRFFGSADEQIVGGTIKPMVYQDGDGTWEPYEFSTTNTDLTLAEGDIYENGQVTRVRKQITFDGSSDEGWNLQSINDYGLANFRMELYPISNGNTRIVLSNRFKRQDSLIANTTEEGIYLNEINQLFVRIDKNRLSTQDTQGFRNWLSTHNLVVEYELATPTTEELEIPTIPSYYPYTEVSTDSEVNPTIDIEYVADPAHYIEKNLDTLEKRIEALEQNALGE